MGRVTKGQESYFINFVILQTQEMGNDSANSQQDPSAGKSLILSIRKLIIFHHFFFIGESKKFLNRFQYVFENARNDSMAPTFCFGLFRGYLAIDTGHPLHYKVNIRTIECVF
jgi:hypothetical protein